MCVCSLVCIHVRCSVCFTLACECAAWCVCVCVLMRVNVFWHVCVDVGVIEGEGGRGGWAVCP